MGDLVKDLWTWKVPLLKACMLCLIAGANTFQTSMTKLEWHLLTSTEKALIVNGIFISVAGSIVAFLDKSSQRVSEGKPPLETGDTKFMKRATQVIVFLMLLSLCGCSTTNITKLAKELSKDPAIISAKVSSIYGTASLVRVGVTTNRVTVSPDGTVTVGER